MHLLTSMRMGHNDGLAEFAPSSILRGRAARRGQTAAAASRQSPINTASTRQYTASPAGRPQSPLARTTGFSTPPQTAQPTGTSWLITAAEKAQYDRFFSTIDTGSSGIISGEQAVRFFSDSRLAEDTLASIWDLADVNSEGHLNKDEFAVAMYLIKQQRAPNPPPLPAFLPPGLVPPAMRGQQQNLQSTAPSFNTNNAPPQPPAQKSASEDLFGLDSSPTTSAQGGGTTTRDAFGSSGQGSPANFQPQSTGGMFKPFMPTSAFGASLAQQQTGPSSSSANQSQTQSRSVSAPLA